MNAQMLLRNPEIQPSGAVLEDVMGESLNQVFTGLFTTIAGNELGLETEWRFYNDTKSWLCKVRDKKKTVFWLSVWEGFFKISFYFTEKHREAVAALDIVETIKRGFAEAKPAGRLIPLIIDVNSAAQLNDVLTIARLKKGLK